MDRRSNWKTVTGPKADARRARQRTIMAEIQIKRAERMQCGPADYARRLEISREILVMISKLATL